MDILKQYLEQSKKDEMINNKLIEVYSTLANINISIDDQEEFREVIVPWMYKLFECGTIRREVLYIGLLANPNILNIFLEYENTTLKLDLRRPKSLFDFVYYRNKHWLIDIIESIDEHSYLKSNLHAVLIILKIIFLTNSTETNIDELRNFLSRNIEDVEPFFKLYIENVSLIAKVVEFIKNNNKQNVSNIFYLLSERCLLNGLSEMVNISNNLYWNDISRFLIENDNFNRTYFYHLSNNKSTYTDEETFIAFTILINVINCLKASRSINECSPNKDNITSILEKVKDELINFKNRTLQIELLQNISALIFLRNDDFKCNTENSFFCRESEIRLLLSLLKSVFEELKKKYSNRIFIEFNHFVDLNMYVTDGYWRLELLNSVKKNWYPINKQSNDKGKDILHYMLSSPEGLINVCLKQNNIEKAIQVVKIFGLEQSSLANEILHSTAITKLRKNVEFHRERGWKNSTLTSIINNHTASCSFIAATETQEQFPYQRAADAVDILITVPLDYSALQELVDIIETEFDDTQTLLPLFYHRIAQMTGNNYYQSDEILLSCNSADITKFDEEIDQYKKLCEAYDSFKKCASRQETGVLNLNHPLHKLLLELQKICIGFHISGKDEMQYMQKLIKYLTAFSKIFFIKQNNADLISKGSEISLFNLLNYKRVDLISKLIYERHVDGDDFDYDFRKMKLDLTYHIAACSFPKVNLNRTNADWGNGQLFKPKRDVINYIQKGNWLLAFMINKIYGIQDEKIDSNEIRIRTLGNLMQSKDVQYLKTLFNDNEILTVLQQDFCTFYITNEGEDAEQNGSFSPILLRLPETNNWKQLYDLISSIKEIRTGDSQIQKLRDLILCNLIKSKQELDHYRYIRFISNHEIRLQIILEEMHCWPAEFCIDIIKFENSLCESDNKVNNLLDWEKRIELYIKMKDIFDDMNWFEIHQFCENNNEDALNRILQIYNIDILVNYLDIYQVGEVALQNISADYLICVFQRHYCQTKIKTLLEKLPQQHFVATCKILLKSVKNLEHLAFILDCLKRRTTASEPNIQNMQVSLKIMTYFTLEEQQQYLCLMGDPLNILEMLLMNTKLEKLGQILEGIQTYIKIIEDDETVISVEKIDELLRTYAEKSVDFKVIMRTSSNSQASESKIMQSIDSLCLEKKVFDMPEKVPAKEEWISDDNVTECMCCYQITFSMFNRRHHCRRCGRVICWNCSLQKMFVESYGDIPVRVCKDCYKQSRSNTSDSDSMKSERSRIDDFWILTDNPEHNVILRQEFSYENAPSVLLCLSILKNHSKTDLYPRFLLNQCENILQILYPIGTYYETEIDFNLIINMLKSLAVAAKMISNQIMLQWGASLADKLISQVEMLGLLAEKGYLHLLSSRSQNIHIDANMLRHVRDKLLELEQWHLALEVSTKAGLDTAGVFARWGKSFLRAGNLQLARLKFHMCFEKCSQYEAPDYSNLYESFSSLRSSSRSLHQSKLSLNISIKPLKSPLLLNEIIQILESKTEKINMKVLKSLSSTKMLYDSASSLQSNPNTPARSEDSVSIINRLQSLNSIANGNFLLPDVNGDVDKIDGPHLENIYYEECIYYLEKYGSHQSLCQFYTRHNDIRQALGYMIKYEVSADIFIDTYMTCLKDGRIHRLQEAMQNVDPTLDMWKNYIRHICIYLEKQCLLHSLYQLQQFIGDFVRAAMTCIKFYSHEVPCFEEYQNRIEYLSNARDHLKQELEQERWVDVQSMSSSQSSEICEEKSISNPALVMKMSEKEVKKHLNTITLQIEVVEFLTECEKRGVLFSDVLTDIQFPSSYSVESLKLPTLFGTTSEKMQLAVFCIIAGQNVEDGFGIAYKVISDYKLKAMKIYCQSGRLLAKTKRHSSIPNLVKCIRSGGEKDSVLTEMCDEMLALTAKTLSDSNATDKQLEDIIKHISNRTIKINSYIETKQLRSAFLLAAKFARIGDIRRISREAELYNKPDVKKLCQKYIQIQEHRSTSKVESS